MRTVLITGIAGGKGQLVAQRLLARVGGGFRVYGVDRRAWPSRPREIGMTIADVRQRKFHDVIRREKPDTIVHLANVRHFSVHSAERHEVNVDGTKRLMEFAVSHGVRQLIVHSSSYVYGALPENPFYMDESFPLSVSRTYPEARDLAEMDMVASSCIWRYPEVAISVLRPVNVLGQRVSSAIGSYLRREFVPTIIGFDPMLQFIHEEDLAEAIAVAIEQRLRGVFNVVGPGAVPLHVAIEGLGATAIPLPEFVLRAMIGRMFRWGLYPFPPGAIDFAKYQCTLDGGRFRAATGFEPAHSLAEIFREAHL